jgi:putative transposase
LTLTPDAKVLLVARLRASGVDGEGVSERVRRAADAAGIGERTLWRWLRDEPAREPSSAAYLLKTEDLDEYVGQRGNAAAVWRARYGDGGGPSLRTLQRAFDRELRPGDRAAVMHGAEGRRRHQVYLRWEARHRNEIWEADHKELEVLVRPPRCRRGQKPWVTMFLDAYSRLIMGWAICRYPSAASVLAALGKAIRLDPERGPFGGVPSTLRPDNGLEFAAGSLARVSGVLGCTLVPTPAYSPHLKGKLERANRTVTQELLAGLPFYTEGPRTIDGRLYGPDAPPMTLEQFVEEFDRWVRAYNTLRAHSALGGQTPLQRWSTDATPIQLLPDADLRWLLLADEERTIVKDGIHFHGLIFVAPELNARVGERVAIRYTPHDDRRIEIFEGEQWLATALPQNALSPEDRDRVLEQRRADAQEQGRRQRRASRQARVRLAAMTKPGPVETTTVIPGERDLSASEGADDLALRRQARTGLLDLTAVVPGPAPGTARPG